MKRWISLILLSLIAAAAAAIGKDKISLEDYGWSSAKSGIQRAKVLYNAQSAAVKARTSVDYSGITSIYLEISSDFISIPLTGRDDFKGVVFYVVNNSKNVPLFACVRNPKRISIPKRIIDGTNFSSFPELREGERLIVIEDKNPWVDNRIGYNYGHTRKDVLLTSSGRAVNTVIAPYNNSQSAPECSFYEVSADSFYVRNFTLNRAASSTFKTICLDIQGLAHVEVSGITINTPESDLTSDYAIRLRDCADVTLSDVTINGTYSKENKYGYGINFNNLWNTRFIRVTGTAPWGVMGNNNMSETYLQGCSINRFDIHCYGRDVNMIDCVFDGGMHGWYSGGSSIFGVIQYDRCIFRNCTPIAYGDSYKVAVGADVIFNDCEFYVSKKHNAVFSTKLLGVAENPRPGLSQKSLPNIEINRMIVHVPEGVECVYLYSVGSESKYNSKVGFLRRIKIHGLMFDCASPSQDLAFKLFSTPVNTDKNQLIEVTGLDAPGITLVPNVTINKKNKVRIRNSSFKPVAQTAESVILRFKD